MRRRRIELIALALTFGFVCFLGGYFTGSRGAVNIIAVEPTQRETQPHQAAAASNAAVSVRTQQPSASAHSAETTADEPAAEEESGVLEEPQYAAAQPPGALRSGDGRININTASKSELKDLPGIGDVLAGRIIDYRNQYGAFSSIDGIMRVSGIGEKRYEAIRDKITVG